MFNEFCMAENLIISRGLSKKEKYLELLPQLKALTEGEPDFIANMANIMAALKQAFDFFWVGIYLVKDNELILGPFQGPVACSRIRKGKGVCGTAWQQKRTVVVEDVEQFPGHIACNAASRSEIVLPAFNAEREVFLVLDVDSEHLAAFDATDEQYLSEVISLIEEVAAQ